MCKALFPKYKYVDIWDYNFLAISEKERIPFTNESDEFLSNLISIHWFEFCMIYLSDKLNIHCETLGGYIKNPIDYLHSEFKKLQKW